LETDPEEGGEGVEEGVAEEETSDLNHQRCQMGQKLQCSRLQIWEFRGKTFRHHQSTMQTGALDMTSNPGSHSSHHLKDKTHGTEILILSQDL
jgi:hypothetical protein